jgi:hypothetical protein
MIGSEVRVPHGHGQRRVPEKLLKLAQVRITLDGRRGEARIGGSYEVLPATAEDAELLLLGS